MEAGKHRNSKDAARTARAEASAWIVQLHGSQRSPALEAGFRTWLAESPENAREFERVTEVWEAGSTPVPGVPRLEQWQARSSTRGLLAAAAAFVAIGLGFWGLNSFWLNPSYSTGIGEQRVLRLDDGTRITLNSDTRLAVAYRKLQRRVQVERGEAYFEVAKDRARPFLVRAGEHRVQALGTVFVVRYDDQRMAVMLVEGRIAVSQEGGASETAAAAIDETRAGSAASLAKEIILTPGERLTFMGGSSVTIDEPRIDAVTAWRRGEVVLDRTSLADAIAEMNRYDATALVIDDPQIGNLEISGIYQTGNSEVFAAAVARLYALQVVHADGQIRLTGARGTHTP